MDGCRPKSRQIREELGKFGKDETVGPRVGDEQEE
jgi:hypothetical protein